MTYILALDQGTTSTRALLFDQERNIIAMAQRELSQIFPGPGWVEHDAGQIYADAVACMRSALRQASVEAQSIAAIGITNQRETIVIWDKASGEPVANAIVWQDRRTAELCKDLRDHGHEMEIAARTGLRLDPYFSATKLMWLLRERPEIAAAAKQGRLLCGTIDSWLIWKLTGGKVHATDATNASRTLMCDIHEGGWNPDLARLFDVPVDMLPEIRDCDADFGLLDAGILGAAIPVRAAIGDQQAAAVAQGCLTPGALKITYGTGCFALLNTGSAPVASRQQLLSTIALQRMGRRSYALEGSIFIAGAVVQWLRDGMGLIASASDADTLAAKAKPGSQIYLVPAFTGLGAPYWDADARGAILGLTRDSGPAEIARAALESVAYQTRDLLSAFAADMADSPATRKNSITSLRVDGGMIKSDYMLHLIADLTGYRLERPRNWEATATGAAWLAGSAAGLYPDLDTLASSWQADTIAEPRTTSDIRDSAYRGWQRAIARIRSS